MSGRSKKKGHGGEHENAERWLLTYADMITLLVAFFIMLYAMSVMNVTKFQQLALSVRSGFGSSMTEGAPTVFSQGGGSSGEPAIVSTAFQLPVKISKKEKVSAAAKEDAARLDTAYKKIKTYIAKHQLGHVMQVANTERGIVVTVMTDKMLFARGQADLRSVEFPVLASVAAVINTVPNDVRVEGHTDSLPIHTARFPSNWELSVTRATNVLRYFETQGVSPKRLEASGYADQRPLAPNDNEVDRARNRRVEIAVIRMASNS